ncbi:DUF5590 domain-containing protein [Paenibacillus sp. KS-LC4]|uniref:cell wall elongation regulator TseB-like domain-containing protein n=1 Tax=Paenibacillus sp. KS-LC4 TaxID=2979727 RepID=UPI0030CDC15F
MRARTRKPFWTVKRAVFISFVFVIALLTVTIVYYRDVHKELWAEEAPIKAYAIEAAKLTEVTGITKQVWDGISWVVQGKTADEQEVYVFLTAAEGPVLTLKPTEHITAEQAEAALQSSEPDAAIKRTQPGLLNGEPVWEIFYSRDEAITKYYYAFYSFRDGVFVKQYRLVGDKAS